MEVLRIYPIFNHVFGECGLDRIYPHVLGLNYSDPQDLTDGSIVHTGFEITPARWCGEIREVRRRYEFYLTDDADQGRLGGVIVPGA